MRKVSKYYGEIRSENASWIADHVEHVRSLRQGVRDLRDGGDAAFAHPCKPGLARHWNVTAPVYRYGIPGHWTAGLENRESCERYRFDLNSRASLRHDLHVKGQDPATLNLASDRNYSSLFPGMDGAGMGRPTARQRPEMPTGSFALKGPRQPTGDRAPAR